MTPIMVTVISSLPNEIGPMHYAHSRLKQANRRGLSIHPCVCGGDGDDCGGGAVTDSHPHGVSFQEVNEPSTQGDVD